MKNEKCSILVVGCDEYVDVAILNAYYKNMYCSNCAFKYYLVTQQKCKELDKTYDEIIYAGKNAAWTDRVLLALKQIDTDYIILLCDDFFVHQEISSEWISEQIEFMEKENVGFIKLMYSGAPKKENKFENGYWNLVEEEVFRVSFTAGLWGKKYLEKLLNKGESAWEAERTCCLNSRNYQEQIAVVDKQYIDIFHTVMSGGWIRKAYRRFVKDEIPSELYEHRKKKSIYIYIKDLIYNIIMHIFDQEQILKLQNKMKIGRR